MNLEDVGHGHVKVHTSARGLGDGQREGGLGVCDEMGISPLTFHPL